MYAWIWRHLPFGLPGRLAGSAVLVASAAALLWFVVFPWIDPFVERTLLPWDDSQLEGDFGPPAGDPGVPSGDPAVPTDPSAEPTIDPHDIPYETDG